MRETKLEVCFVIIWASNLRAALFWLFLEWSCSKPKSEVSVKQLQLFCNLPPLLFDQFNYSLANSSQNQTDLRRSDLPAMETTMDVSVAVQSHCSAISWTTLFYQSAPSHPKPPTFTSQLRSGTPAIKIPRKQPLMAIDVLTRSVTAVHHVKAAFNILCRGRLF